MPRKKQKIYNKNHRTSRSEDYMDPLVDMMIGPVMEAVTKDMDITTNTSKPSPSRRNTQFLTKSSRRFHTLWKRK